ncbi:hypothetical protein Tco_0713704 [Tanacetum coccineum]|uniref:Uncharacterized protein n=1 Tax=Tanacetum coccineum TaxID=301880 RepID=A0ABQ4WED6_9ASTR
MCTTGIHGHYIIGDIHHAYTTLHVLDGLDAFIFDIHIQSCQFGESRITHTESPPFEDLADNRSPRANDHKFLELPYMPEDPYFEAALQAPPSPNYHAMMIIARPAVSEDALPHCHCPPDYVPSPDPRQPIEDDDEDPEEILSTILLNGGDDGDY